MEKHTTANAQYPYFRCFVPVNDTAEFLHYVLLDIETEELKQDEFLTEEDAQDINEKLLADGSQDRWVLWEESECA